MYESFNSVTHRVYFIQIYINDSNPLPIGLEENFYGVLWGNLVDVNLQFGLKYIITAAVYINNI